MQNRLIITILLLISFSFTAASQKLINSPFSRFNIGTMEPAGSFRSLGMGGISTSVRGNNTLYFSNPASYSSLDTNSFIFDFGVDYGRNILSDGISSHSSDDFNFDHLLFGFPLAKGWGIGAGIVPYSSGYYKLSETGLDDESVGEYNSTHSGQGGFTSFFLGTGVKISKNFSAGVNMTLLFGELSRSYQLSFADFYAFSNNSTEKLQMNGINFDYGIQYTAALKNDYFFNAGISLTTGKYYNTEYSNLTYKSTISSIRDTISYVFDDWTSAYIPGTLRMGISFGKKNKFTTGLDYITTEWSKSKIPGSQGYSADTRKILFGAEYTPDKFSNFSPLKRMDYRIGGHVGDNYLVINGVQVKEFGASFGIGIPMRRLSSTNIFFDYTRKTGSSVNRNIQEDYFTAGVSLNFYDWWFLQRKYD
jgi:hypothetical protein